MVKVITVVQYNGVPITTGLPIPAQSNNHKTIGRPFKYPFFAMEVGDSFVSEKSCVRSAASIYGKRYNLKFTTRSQSDGTTRVWRVT